MEISGSNSAVTQEMTNTNARAGFDVLTKTLAKTDQNEQKEQQRMEVAEQTGKGLNIDTKA